MQLQRGGDSASALAQYRSILEIDPRQPAALNSMGIILTDGGQLADAQDAFCRAIAIDGTAPELWMNLAKAQRLDGDDAGELASIEGALAIDQRHFMARVRKAELHERRGETGLATQEWSAVAQMGNGLAEGNPALGQILAHAQIYLAERGAEFSKAIFADIAKLRSEVDDTAARRFDAFVDTATKGRKIYHNECAGTFYPFLQPDEFFARSHFPWLETLEANTEAIRAELSALLDSGGNGFAPYVSMPPGTPENKWSELSDSNRWDACYIWKYGQRIDAIAEKCPTTVRVLDAISRFDAPGRGPTAFFSLLRPKTRIPPHTGVSNTRAIVHVPLIVPDGCRFRVGGETRSWVPGTAFAFDDTIEHEAVNDSDELRAVLIFDVWNPHINDEERILLRGFWRSADASGLRPEVTHDI